MVETFTFFSQLNPPSKHELTFLCGLNRTGIKWLSGWESHSYDNVHRSRRMISPIPMDTVQQLTSQSDSQYNCKTHLIALTQGKKGLDF